MNIRRATPEEADKLTSLALRSKRYWKYSEEFIQAFKPELILSPKYLAEAVVLVGEIDENLVGFAGLSSPEKDPELVFLFIDPPFINKGMGSLLWKAAVEQARQFGWKNFKIICDVNAESFYLKLGALRVGDYFSPYLPKIPLPLLTYTLSPK